MDREINFNKNIEKIDEYLRNLIPFGFSGTVLIAKGDEILLENGYGYRNYENKYKMKKDTIMSIGSISKQFTSTMIMQFVDQGKLDVQDTLSKFFDVPEDKKNITIHQLMTHTSGIKDHFGDDFVFMETDEFLRKIFEEKIRTPLGSEFSYSNLGYSLLAIIIQNITGKSYQEYLIQDIFTPQGITNSGWFGDERWNEENSTNYYLDGKNTGSISSWSGSHDKPYWAILGNGGVCISNKDLFNWIRALMKSKIISENSLNKMLTPEKNDYGYGWDIESSPLGRLITHDGGNNIGVNAVAKYYEEVELTIIINSNVIQNGIGMGFQIRNLIEKLLMADEITLPPYVNNYGRIKEGIYAQGENYIEINSNPLNQYSLAVVGQNLLSIIDNEIPIRIAEQCNTKVYKFANAMFARKWEEAFSYIKNTEVTERRINFLEGLMDEFEKEYGLIINFKISGTIPMNKYYGLTHLMIVGEKGSSGIPIVWEDENTILGFRTRLSPYPITMQMASKDNNIIAYNIDSGKSIILRHEDENSISFESTILKQTSV